MKLCWYSDCYSSMAFVSDYILLFLNSVWYIIPHSDMNSHLLIGKSLALYQLVEYNIT